MRRSTIGATRLEIVPWTGMLFMAFLGAAVLTVRLERERDE
jgi:hypothetical protein